MRQQDGLQAGAKTPRPGGETSEPRCAQIAIPPVVSLAGLTQQAAAVWGSFLFFLVPRALLLSISFCLAVDVDVVVVVVVVELLGEKKLAS